MKVGWIFRACWAAAALAGSGAGQTAGSADYDAAYIGPRMADPLMQHSKETYVAFGCAYCHGIYLTPRGEASDLMHSRLVGRDENANVMGPLLRSGIPQTAKLSPMPQFSDLSERQIADIARWIHYARQQGRYKELAEAKELGPGDAVAGKAYFEQTCGGCHSAGELGRAAKQVEPGEVRRWMVRPNFVDAESSWTLDRLHDPKEAGRARHLLLLENYSAADIANLQVYLFRPR